MSKESLKKKIETIKELTGLSQQEISVKAGYKVNTLAQTLAKESGHSEAIKQLDLVFSDILTESTHKTYLEKRREIKKNGRKAVPLFDAPVEAGGELRYSEMAPISAPAGTIDVGDLLSDSECALRVYGNSMIPNYPPGCVVGLIKCTKSFIEPGEVYVIETKDRRVIKRVFYDNDDPKTNTLTCYSDNMMKFDGGPRHGKFAYPIFNIDVQDVINLYQVTGVIKRNANSVIVVRDY